MMRRIAIVNPKGGVGKTTLAVNLSYALSEAGQSVLLVDLDPQANTTLVYLRDKTAEKTIYDVFLGRCRIKDIIIQVNEKLNIVPASTALVGADIEFANEVGRETKLKKALKRVEGYDFVFFDTPPSLSLLTLNALIASEEVFISVSMGLWPVKALEVLEKAIGEVRTNFGNPNLIITGVIGNFYESQTYVSKDIVEIIKEHFGSVVFQTLIPRSICFEEANAHGLSVIEFDNSSRGTEVFRRLAEEVLNRDKEKRNPKG